MKKLEMKTIDGVQENLSKIEQLFPTVITESMDEKGNIVKTVDFEKLKQELSTVVSTGKETYEFRWVGKDNAIVEANTKTDKALRPCKEESKNWDKTENLYIEGDNLEVLKILKNSYKKQVKMIYIDPPYNTGKDTLIYPDDYSENKDQYDEKVGVIDENGYHMFKNMEANGRFHSNWCSMMYPRLKVARNLLTEDGVIFISIGDNEVDNLRKICDEIFGQQNFIGEISREMKKGANRGTHLSPALDYILVYAKEKNQLNKFYEPFNNDYKKSFKYNDNDGKGFYKKVNLYEPTLDYYENCRYEIKCPDGSVAITPEEKSFRCNKESFYENLKNNEIIFEKKDSLLVDKYGNNSEWTIFQKLYLKNMLEKGRRPSNLFLNFINAEGTKELTSLRMNVFSFSKPVELITYLIKLLYNNNIESEDKKNFIILDFFSGSATTAHAVMQLNAEDVEHFRFIMVQIPEPCEEKSKAYKAGYKDICEIGKERIRRAGEKIVKETGKTDLDIGFRVYKLDSGNYEQVFKAPGDLKQSDLENAIETIKRDRTDEDLLFGTLLAWGADTCLSMSYDVVLVGKYKIYVVKNGAVPELVACFDEDVNDDVIRKMAEYKPMRVAFRERSLKTVERRANAENLLKQLHPLLEENDIRLI